MMINLNSRFCLWLKTILSDQVGSGSPAQRVNPFAPAPVPVQPLSNGGGSFAAGKEAPVPVQAFSNKGGSFAAGKAEGSLLSNNAAEAVLSSSSRDSSRRRRPSGNQVGISGIQLPSDSQRRSIFLSGLFRLGCGFEEEGGCK